MAIIWGVFLTIIAYFVIRYYWSRRHLYITSMKLNGPLSLPIIGAPLPFMFCKTEDLLHKMYDIVQTYGNPLRMWLGPQLVVIFKEPEHVEKVLTSSKFSHKHDMYELFKNFLGEGLITSSGSKYKNSKKILQPLFSLGFSTECVAVLEKHLKICIQKLDSCVDQGYFDIGHAIHLCTSDIMGGYDFEAQKGKSQQYLDGFTEYGVHNSTVRRFSIFSGSIFRIYKLAFGRVVRPWLYPNLIYNFTSSGQRTNQICQITNQLIEKSLQRRSSSNSILDQILEHRSLDPGTFPDTDLGAHLVTLYMASQDTIALIASAACLCFAMYPEYQQEAVDEIHQVFGKSCENINVEDLTKLQYLDRCVKDVFRLFPIAPYVFRKNLEDLQVDKWFLPKNCGIGIPIYNLHKDPRFWENPNHFHPDHFLHSKRPKYAYVPFSAGPRSCIGKIFANVGVKVILIRLLQTFQFEASGKFPDLRLTMDISLRSLNGYKVKLKRRGS